MTALTRAVSDRWTAWRAVLAGPWQRWIAAPFAVMTAFQAIRDEVLPADLKEKLRLLRWLPDWRWYVWALIALGVFCVALLEGSYQVVKKVKDANKPRSSQGERFNVLRQRVLHTPLSNDLPLELHAPVESVKCFLAPLAASLLLITSAARVNAADHVVKFSAEDIAVLKQLKTVKDVADASARLLLSSPVIELLASPNPVDVAITLTTADWSGMTNGTKGLQKITACRMLTIVQEHLSDATSDRVPTGEAANYFQTLENGFSKQC